MVHDSSMIIKTVSASFALSAAVYAASPLLQLVFFIGRDPRGDNLVIPARLAWAVQEFPSFALPLFYITGSQSVPGIIVLLAFLIHYLNRTFIYPFQIKSGNGTPWYICVSAIVFCTWNGYLQGSYHSQYYQSDGFFSRPLTYLGITVFATGMYINIWSDSILRNLRKPGETGGMFEYVSGANFFGEIVEWTGYAIVSGSLPATAFAIFTMCNIGPRAIHHHRWYLSKFPDYPKNRKAIIPFLL
ncbi:3-oxo-5-alpha-steroid 4-dehydrogenase [Ancylostoma ceylanicum]|uniref:3-oxo-5alpha-steroid 4-dehydrogenase (NADP(+)) n=1 Tax=Ancylostoma ceylanicum TaxID=53326 RepID=A0A0D6LG74_9BILA|nr:3-oxo-5-alpha-steroid 4-dehydrogenase [Ancylostoma ceylanicum]